MGDDRATSGWAPRAKVRAPGRPSDLVLDEDLVARTVQMATSKPLTVIVAAPGAGKTTLAAAVAGVVGAAAWVRLDEHDDDPAILLELVATACREVGAVDRSSAEPLLAAGLATPVAARRAVAALLDDLGRGPCERLLIVLDDLHAVTSDDVLRVIAYLVEHLPPHVHVLVTSRSRPALPLARLDARQSLGLVGDDDLALDAAQAARLLNDTLDLALDPADVEALVASTSGWVTGIRLLGRSPAALGEYIDEELLGLEAPDTARFLVDLSVLETITPASAAALTGRDDAGALLWDLARRHSLFLEVVDPDEPEYRLHDLLRSHLRRRLRTLDPGRLGLLHQVAASIATSDAERIEHLLAAGAWEDAAAAIDAAADPFAGPARLQRVAAWGARLPEPHRQGHRLRLVTGLAAVRRGDVDTAVDQLEALLPALAADADDEGVWLATRALHLATYDHARFVPRLAAKERTSTFGRLPPAARAEHHMASAYGALYSGSWGEVARRVEAAIGIATATGDVEVAESLAQHLGPLLAGAPGVAERVDRYADWAAERIVGHPLVDAGVVHQRAWAKLLLGDPRRAAAAVRAGAEVRVLIDGFPYLRATLDWVLAIGAVIEGDHRAAEQIVVAGLEMADPTPLDASLDTVRRCGLARLLRQRGDVEGLRRLVGRVELVEGDAGARDHSGNVRGSTTAQLAWAEGDLRGAEQALRAALDVERVERVRPFVVNPSVDLALVLHEQGREREALAVLSDAVTAFGTWGTPGLLVVAGREVVPLLRRLPASPTVATALAALDEDALPAARPIPGSAEALTGREVQVLRLLDDGASNQVIADTLVISANTAKSHVRNVLGKLGATSRGEAVAVARRHRLL